MVHCFSGVSFYCRIKMLQILLASNIFCIKSGLIWTELKNESVMEVWILGLLNFFFNRVFVLRYLSFPTQKRFGKTNRNIYLFNAKLPNHIFFSKLSQIPTNLVIRNSLLFNLPKSIEDVFVFCSYILLHWFN